VDTLRKVIALGGRVGSPELREWASQELHGYVGSDVELPGYRKVAAVLAIDVLNPMGRIVTGQQISPLSLPEGIRDVIGEVVPLGQGIGEIEGMLESARAGDGVVKLAPPESQTLARIIEHEYEADHRGQHIMAVYWPLGQVPLRGVLDRVRTTLVELVAEMRAGTSDAGELPSREVAAQAVNVAVYGNKARVNVASSQISGGGSHDVKVTQPADGRSIWVKVGAGVVGLATVVGALVAVATWQGWWS
jgi:hypothetical protein